jgi:hypothetical protein
VSRARGPVTLHFRSKRGERELPNREVAEDGQADVVNNVAGGGWPSLGRRDSRHFVGRD